MSIYLDWNATTPVRDVAADAWLATQRDDWGNASSIHSFGQSARHHWDAAKASVAKALGCRASSVVFTGSGTEANNLAIHAACKSHSSGNIIAAAVDHSSILRPLADRGDKGLIAHTLRVDGNGLIAADHLVELLSDETRLVCLQFANNELGTCQPIAELTAIIRKHAPQALIHCDACQGVGKALIASQELGVDTLSISAHKFGGPKGVGALLCLKAGPMAPLIHGGQQQQDRRSGSEDVAGAAALAAALSAANAELENECPRQAKLLTDCFAQIQAVLPEAQWLGRDTPRLSNTFSLAHPGLQSDPLVMRLDMAGIAVSRGSACMAARKEPSHVIRALNLPEDVASSAIRISIGYHTTAEDMQHFAEAYADIAKKMLAKLG